MIARRPLLQLDWGMILPPVALTTIGILLVFSASYHQGTATTLLTSPWFRHGMFALVGLCIMLGVARLDYRVFRTFTPHFYVLVLGLLALVDIVGQSVLGVKRWVDIGPLQLQPSELAKFATVLVLARLFADYKDQAAKPHMLVISLVLVLIPTALVFVQPDLGTAIVFGIIWVGMAVMAGVRTFYLAALGAVGIAATIPAYLFVLKEYQKERVHTFLDPSSDPLGAGYNILQSEISVGSGGLLGKGLMNGTQSQLHFLRVQQTDFIFSVLGEELGFVGALLVFMLFAVLLWRGLEAAQNAREDFGRLVATGVVVMILAQTFINIGVNIRIFPVTGIPLPFISAGGSSLLTMFFALGVLQSVYRHRSKPKW